MTNTATKKLTAPQVKLFAEICEEPGNTAESYIRRSGGCMARTIAALKDFGLVIERLDQPSGRPGLYAVRPRLMAV